MSLSLLSTHRNSRCTWIATYFVSLLNLLIFLLLPVVAFRATKIGCLWAEPCPHLWLWNLSFLGLCSKSSQFYSFSWECFNTQSNFTQFSSALGNQFLWTLRSVLHLSDKSSHLLSCINGNPSWALSLRRFNTATQIHKTAFTRHNEAQTQFSCFWC